MKGYYHLTQTQRYSIQRFIENGETQGSIAFRIGVHQSTISRELKRHRTPSTGKYNALNAHRQALMAVPHPVCYDDKRKIRGALEEIIIEKLNLRWSPEQISGRLKLEGTYSISHEAIYRFIYTMRKCGGDLHRCLRRFGRRKAKRGIYKHRMKWVEPRKFIQLRPDSANNRNRFGDWERDLLNGRMSGPSVLTIVDRKSRYTLLRKVNSHFASEVNKKTADALGKKSGLPCCTITNDNGAEFGVFKDLEKALQVPVYYTNPYHSWERGTNENTNGLLRQFIPKKTDLTDIPDSEFKKVEDLINSRPRKILDYRTPEETLYSREDKLVKSIGYYKKLIQEKEEKVFESWPYKNY